MHGYVAVLIRAMPFSKIFNSEPGKGCSPICGCWLKLGLYFSSPQSPSAAKCIMCGVKLGDAQASVPPALQKAQALAAVAFSVPAESVDEWLHQRSASDQHLTAMEEDLSGEATAATAQMMSEIYLILTPILEKIHNMTAVTSGGRLEVPGVDCYCKGE